MKQRSWLKKLKTTVLTILGLGLLALACVAVFRRGWTDAPSKRSATFLLEQYTAHVRHPRTGLCFMISTVPALAFTNVPCTPEVLREIERAR